MRPIFPQNVIAVIWDFDTTLSPAYMQGPLFRKYGVDESAFWSEVNSLPELLGRGDDSNRTRGAVRVNADTIYLNRILDYVRAGVFPDLTNEVLRELGSELEFYPGLPDGLKRLRDYVAVSPEYHQFELRLEHYVVSTGLREMIVGSTINDYIDGVWGCEFAESSPPPLAHKRDGQLALEAIVDGPRVISQVAYAIDNTSKTRAIFEINKGSNRHPHEIDVNSFMRPEDRRVPIQNMIYVADGPSDTPVFSVVASGGGKTFAVYPPGDAKAFRQANNLQVQGRVHAVGEADYLPGSHASLWLEAEIDRIAERIVASRHRDLREQVGQPAKHLTSKTESRRSTSNDKQTSPDRTPRPSDSVESAVRSGDTAAEAAQGQPSLRVDAIRGQFAMDSDTSDPTSEVSSKPSPSKPRRGAPLSNS